MIGATHVIVDTSSFFIDAVGFGSDPVLLHRERDEPRSLSARLERWRGPDGAAVRRLLLARPRAAGETTAVALVTAGVISVLVFPSVAIIVRRPGPRGVSAEPAVAEPGLELA
jgi:hypothetical protein